MYVVVVCYYFVGGSFLVGGFLCIVDIIVEVLVKIESIIFISVEVDEVFVENNEVRGVCMVDGIEFYVDWVVSGVGIFIIYQYLLFLELV